MDEKGIEMLGAEFVLDEFHIQKYIRKMARLAADGGVEEEREAAEKRLQEWAVQAGAGLGEKMERSLWKAGIT